MISKDVLSLPSSTSSSSSSSSDLVDPPRKVSHLEDPIGWSRSDDGTDRDKLANCAKDAAAAADVEHREHASNVTNKNILHGRCTITSGSVVVWVLDMVDGERFFGFGRM